MIKALKEFFDRHNLRPFECTWLLWVHVVAILGIVYAACYAEHISKIVLVHCILHAAYGMGITVGAHRLWAHKSYQGSFTWRLIMMLLNSGAAQGSIFHWSRDHRLHHKFSDTELDPHTISRGFFFAHVGWLLEKKSPKLVEEGRKIDISDLKNDKIVMFQKKYYAQLSILMCFVVPTIAYSYFAMTPIWAGFLLSYITYALILNSTWCVNSICHMFGSRPYNDKIEPRENFFVSIITLGEGYHNWHHEYPSCWKASKDEWWMINVSARFIELGSLLGLNTTKRQ